ncbi:MAG: hypothetical protein ABMB14_17210, partial [Myxococcota bacterium]
PKDLRAILAGIGRPSRVTDSAAASVAVQAVIGATSDLDGWLVFPAETQRALVGLVSSIARHLQDEIPDLVEPAAAETLRAWFPAMTHWSKLYRPGFVPGLSRKFTPERDAWSADAEHWWWVLQELANPTAGGAPPRASEVRPWIPPMSVDEPAAPTPADALRDVERAVLDPALDLGAALQRAADAGVPQRDPRLVKTLLPHRDRVAALPGLKTLKAALKAAGGGPTPEEDDTEDEPTAASLVPLDWSYFPYTDGKHAVIVGGDRRPQAADRIRDAFRFAAVDWEVTDARRIRTTAERIRSGSVELVILLRGFIRHTEQETILDACRSGGVGYVVVDTGYGVNQVKLAIERFCQVRDIPTGT